MNHIYHFKHVLHNEVPVLIWIKRMSLIKACFTCRCWLQIASSLSSKQSACLVRTPPLQRLIFLVREKHSRHSAGNVWQKGSHAFTYHQYLPCIHLPSVLLSVLWKENKTDPNGIKFACFISLRHNSLSYCVFFQCQWSHIGGSLHSRTTTPFRIPNDAFWTVLGANLLYAAVPILVAMRVQSNPYFFLKIAPFPGQTGLPNSEEKDTKYKEK